MIKIIFLSLLLFSSLVFAQAQEKPQAYKFFEYGKIGDEFLKEKYREFYREIKKDGDVKKDDGSRGYIINYGTDKEIAKREKQIRDAIGFVCLDPSIMIFVRGKDENKPKTVFWVVPKDAEPPTP